MANANNPKGFIPREHLSGGEIRAEAVTLNSANSAIGRGDPVVAANGTYNIWVSGRIDGIAANGVAASGTPAGGVFLVYRDPNIVYSIITDGLGGNLEDTNGDKITENATLTLGTPTAQLVSTTVLNSASSATATQPVKVRGLYQATGNTFGQYNELLVTLNNHPDKGGTGTAGV